MSDCERSVSRFREELNCAEVRGNTPVQIGRRKKTAKKLKSILIEVNGGVVSYVQLNGKPVTAYYLLDWDELLGDSDTRRAWEGLGHRSINSTLGYIGTSDAQAAEALQKALMGLF